MDGVPAAHQRGDEFDSPRQRSRRLSFGRRSARDIARPALADLNPQRILLIKPSALGDVVQTLPLLTALRERWPDAHIAWVIKESLADLLTGHPDLDEVITYKDRARRLHYARALADLWIRLRRTPYDLAIDVQGLMRSGGMALASRAHRRVGFSTAREGAGLAYTDEIPVPTLQMPATQRYWLIAQALGLSNEVSPARIGLTPEYRQWAGEQLRDLPRPILAVHPGAKWQTKRWPAEHFAELCQRAVATFGAGVVLLGGPEIATECQHVATSLPGQAVNFAGRTSLRQLAAVADAADTFLSCDSGPMHLAAALGTPVVGVFTCTSPLRAAPHGDGHRSVQTEVSCAASYLRTCPHLKCMSELTPERVWPALNAVLSELPGMHSIARAS